MTTVNYSVRGPFKVLAIDLTNDQGGWEHRCSTQIVDALLARSVPVVDNAVQRIAELRPLAELFERVRSDYSVLILFGHGAKGDGSTAGGVDVGTLEASWHLLEQVEMHAEDALVVLCVCEGLRGLCPDAINTIVRGAHLALTIVAPKAGLSPQEAGAFVPAFIIDLFEQRPTGRIDFSVLEYVLADRGALSGNKMQLPD